MLKNKVKNIFLHPTPFSQAQLHFFPNSPTSFICHPKQHCGMGNGRLWQVRNSLVSA